MTAVLNLRTSALLDIDDSGRILVANDETGSAQLVEVDSGGVWRRLTALSEPVTGRYIPGTNRLAVLSVNPSGSERTQLYLLDLETGTELPEPKPFVIDPTHINDLLAVGQDVIYYSTNRRNEVDFDIVARTVSTGAERVLYDGGGWFQELAISRDNAWIVGSRLTAVAASTQLLLINVQSGDASEITDPAEPGEWKALSWLPDGELLASTDAGSDRFGVRRFDPEAKSWETVLDNPEADVAAFPTADGMHWAVITSAEGADRIEVHSVSAAGIAPTGHRVDLPGRGKAWWFTSLHWSPNGDHLGFTYTSPTAPPEAYSWSMRSGSERRTVSNPPSSLPELVTPTSHRFSSYDGESVPVFVMRNAEPTGSAVIVIHGGPEGESALAWNPVSAALALDGHTVVIPNVRGSAGYGRRWISLDDVEKRLDSVADLAALHSWLPTVDVDPGRVALYGGSYGGYMVLAGLTFHAGLWAAGVDIVGMSSLTTFMENTSPYRRAYREREYGSLANHRDVLEAASPLPIIDRLNVPLFIIHGRNDPRVPVSEAEQVAAAVRANGAHCEMVIYEDEGHGLAKRANRLDAYPKVAAFLAEFLG